MVGKNRRRRRVYSNIKQNNPPLNFLKNQGKKKVMDRWPLIHEILYEELRQFSHQAWFYEELEKAATLFSEGKEQEVIITGDVEVVNDRKRFYAKVGEVMARALLCEYHPLHYLHNMPPSLLELASYLRSQNFPPIILPEDFKSSDMEKEAVRKLVNAYLLPFTIHAWNTPLYNAYKEAAKRYKELQDEFVRRDLWIEEHLEEIKVERLREEERYIFLAYLREKDEERWREEVKKIKIGKVTLDAIKNAPKPKKLLLYEFLGEKEWLMKRVEEIEKGIREIKDKGVQIVIKKMGRKRALWGNELYEKVRDILLPWENINGPSWYLAFYKYLIEKEKHPYPSLRAPPTLEEALSRLKKITGEPSSP